MFAYRANHGLLKPTHRTGATTEQFRDRNFPADIFTIKTYTLKAYALAAGTFQWSPFPLVTMQLPFCSDWLLVSKMEGTK